MTPVCRGPCPCSHTALEADDKAGGDADQQKDKEAKEKEKEEPGSFVMDAPCRVTPKQAKCVSFPPDSRWVPVKAGAAPVGIVVVRDTQPGEAVEYVAGVGGQQSGAAGAASQPGGAAAAAPAPAAPAAAAQEQEPAPPEPFGGCLSTCSPHVR